MRVEYFLFLIGVIALCDGGRPPKSNLAGTSPDNISVKSQGDKILVSWSKKPSSDSADPILGYKVKIWTVKKVKKTEYKFDTKGELVSTETEVLPPLDNIKDVSNEFTEIDVPADKTEAIYNGVKQGTTYEVGVLAYTKKNQGAFTRKSRIQLN